MVEAARDCTKTSAQTSHRNGRLPIGLGGQFSVEAGANWKEQYALFKPVDNEVIWVNPHIHAPFNLVEGQRTDLGLFALRNSKVPPCYSEIYPGEQLLELWRGHGRSAVLGRVFIADNNGNVWRDVDLKGAGHVVDFYNPYAVPPKVKAIIRTGNPMFYWGLLSLDEALADAALSEEFQEEGIRTYRTVVVTAIKEFFSEGKRYKVGEGLAGFNPAIQVRLFSTKARIADIHTVNPLALLMYRDGKKLVAEELGVSEISDDEYITWYAGTLGRNLALLHGKGLFHGNMGAQNLTLDCRIVDWDSVEKLEWPNTEERDADNISRNIDTLARSISRIFEVDVDAPNIDMRYKYRQVFKESYEAVHSQVKKTKDSRKKVRHEQFL